MLIYMPCVLYYNCSTGPRSRYTHWKQTVFYLNEALTLHKGEVIEGVVACARNDKNPRDLNISFKYKLDGKTSTVDTKQEFRLR